MLVELSFGKLERCSLEPGVGSFSVKASFTYVGTIPEKYVKAYREKLLSSYHYGCDVKVVYNSKIAEKVPDIVELDESGIEFRLSAAQRVDAPKAYNVKLVFPQHMTCDIKFCVDYQEYDPELEDMVPTSEEFESYEDAEKFAHEVNGDISILVKRVSYSGEVEKPVGTVIVRARKAEAEGWYPGKIIFGILREGLI